MRLDLALEAGSGILEAGSGILEAGSGHIRLDLAILGIFEAIWPILGPI